MTDVHPNRPALTVGERIDEILDGYVALMFRDKLKVQIKRLVLEGAKKELEWEKLILGENEQTLSADGVHQRPAALGRNKLKDSLRKRIDSRLAALNRQIEGLEGER